MRGIPNVLVILGPTASGKSALAVDLARVFGGEVISADSRQVYRGLDIGTAKIAKREMKGIPHHLLDVAHVRKPFTAFDFKVLANKIIGEIVQRKHVPIVAGGTGFYIDALTDRVHLPHARENATLRKKLEAKSLAQLYAMVRRRDPARAHTIDRHNKRRLVRALEIATAKPSSVETKPAPTLNALWIGLLPSSELRQKIEERARKQIHDGLIDEVRNLRKQRIPWKRIHDLGFEYSLVATHIRGTLPQNELASRIASQTWRYAKRQMTYWRRNSEIRWFKPSQKKLIEQEIKNWLRK